MPVRMAVTKVSGQGEQLVIDVSQWNGVTGEIVHKDMSEMSSLLDEALALADLRVQEMKLRMLEAYNLEVYFKPETWQRVVSILDILAGRQSADTVLRRWQSEVEETADLEAGRLAAYKQQGQYDGVASDRDLDRVAEVMYDSDYTNMTIVEQDAIRTKIAELGCTCAHTPQYQCPVHSDNGRGA